MFLLLSKLLEFTKTFNFQNALSISANQILQKPSTCGQRTIQPCESTTHWDENKSLSLLKAFVIIISGFQEIEIFGNKRS